MFCLLIVNTLKKKTTLPLYWKCQLIGWSVASFYWGYIGFLGGRFNYFIGSFQFISDVALYILITHLYRNFALRRHWQQLNPGDLLKRLVPAAVVLGLVYLLTTATKIYLFNQWLASGNAGPFINFFKVNWLLMFTAGVRLMSIWLLAYHLYHYGKREVGLVRENSRLALIAKDAQLSNLSSQLNPHFLFNSLNNIKALVIEDPKSARRAIDLLSDLLRTSLYNNDLLLCTIKDELALVTDYLELEKLRLEERLQFSITCAHDLGTTLILRYSIQVLAENAIKHGIGKQKQGGLVNLKITPEADFIKMVVENPGKLDMAAPLEGLGLKNLTERLSLQYKGKAKFEIVGSDGIVSASLLIPNA